MYLRSAPTLDFLYALKALLSVYSIPQFSHIAPLVQLASLLYVHIYNHRFRIHCLSTYDFLLTNVTLPQQVYFFSCVVDVLIYSSRSSMIIGIYFSIRKLTNSTDCFFCTGCLSTCMFTAISTYTAMSIFPLMTFQQLHIQHHNIHISSGVYPPSAPIQHFHCG